MSESNRKIIQFVWCIDKCFIHVCRYVVVVEIRNCLFLPININLHDFHYHAMFYFEKFHITKVIYKGRGVKVLGNLVFWHNTTSKKQNKKQNFM